MHLGRSGVAEGIELAHRLTNLLEVGSRNAKALGVPGDPIKKMKRGLEKQLSG